MTVWGVTGGVLSAGVSYALPTGSVNPQSVAISSDGAYLTTAGFNGSVVTVMKVTGGVLSGGVSYPLPSGVSEPTSVVFSPNDAFLVASSGGYPYVVVFQVRGRRHSEPRQTILGTLLC